MKAIQKQNHAFTLIELLVVMAVIGILMGMLFPALNMIRQRAWDTSARDLCQQTCVGGNALLMQHRRYPPMTLLEKFKTDTQPEGGDIEVRMNTEATSLLNWWRPRHPDPAKDDTAYGLWLKNYVLDPGKPEKGIVFNPSGFGIAKWPKNLNDIYLERTSDQRKWGLVAPWVKRYVSDATEDTLNDETKARLEAATVHVILDTNGDGKITIPANHPCAKGVKIELNKTVVAWVYADEKRSRTIQSW